MSKLSYWIKERHNPQLGKYYSACGQMTTKDAKRHEDALYGTNYMHRFATHDAYVEKIDELQRAGERFVP